MLMNDIYTYICNYIYILCDLLGRERCWNLGSRMWREKHRFESGIYWRVRKWASRDIAPHRSICTLRDDKERYDLMKNQS
jgi:hypothetical protein